MPIAAAIGAVGAIGSAGISAYSASKASDQQVAQQDKALGIQQQNFGNALDFQKGAFDTSKNALNPFITAGTNVLPTLQGEITGGSGNTYADYLKTLLTPGQSADALAAMPGFQFQSQYGTMAATNALAARGLAGSGGVLGRALSDYNNGLAGTQYFNTVNALQGAQAQRVGQLQGFAGLGVNAAGALSSAAGTAGANVGGLTANTNNTLGTTLTNTGNAAAAGTLGVGNALSGGLTGGANSGTNALLLSRLFPGSGGGNEAFGGESGGIYGGSSRAPLPGLSAADYGAGF